MYIYKVLANPRYYIECTPNLTPHSCAQTAEYVQDVIFMLNLLELCVLRTKTSLHYTGNVQARQQDSTGNVAEEVKAANKATADQLASECLFRTQLG